jgi:hypothetical protein
MCSRRSCRSGSKVLALLALASTGAAADPFPTRDQNPLLAGYGLTMPLRARLPAAGAGSAALDFNWASTELRQGDGEEAAIIDAETREARFTWLRGLNDRIAVQLQIPYRYTGAGTLDGFIDNWHDLFGLPEGARPELPDDQLLIAYERDGTTQLYVDSSLDIERSRSGLGDISADLGYQLSTTTSSAAAAWLSVKLPTGDADELTGSGAVDVALSLAGEYRLADRWTAYGQAGATWLGNGDLLPEQQRSVVWSAMAGIGWQAWRGLTLKLQVDAHSAAFDDVDLDYFGDAVILTVGGDYRFASAWQLDIGVSEDIAVETSPDVVFVIGLSKHY